MSPEHLPHRPSLRQLKSLAKDLRRAAAAQDAAALARVRAHHPRHAGAADEPARLTLQDAQLVIAREHGCDSWPRLTAAVAAAAGAVTPGPIAGDVLGALVGDSAPLQTVRHLLERAAETRNPVLLCGERGTGKRLLAQLLRRMSGSSPWAEVHCDARPGTLGEADLFGFEPGAFTGARVATVGALEQAAGGLLLLSEVGELDVSAQQRLFEALETGAVRRLGGTEGRAVDARLVCTTSVDLRQQVQASAFREDLYYHLQVLRIDLPPLRERLDDIAPLARHFVSRVAGATPSLTEAALVRLREHSWPGNVRELRHVVEGAALTAGEVIDVDDLRLDAQTAGGRPA